MQYLIDGMHGIGDNINQRCFIKSMLRHGHNIWLKTPVPEIYIDLNKPGRPKRLHFVRTHTTLRTQAINEKNTLIIYETEPLNALRKRIFYGVNDLLFGNVYMAMTKQFGFEPDPLSLPDFGKLDLYIPEKFKKCPIAVIRPTTERLEWHNASRGPDNAYINNAALQLKNEGYFVISVGFNQGTEEWMPGIEPFSHLKFNKGELSLTEMFKLIKMAHVVVTGPSVIFHAALAYNRPIIGIFGGNGGNNHHLRITDPRVCDMGSMQSVGGDCEQNFNALGKPIVIRKNTRNYFIYPDNYCFCQIMKHKCDKKISNFNEKLLPFLKHLKSTR